MKVILNSKLLPGLLATSVLGTTLPAPPASADLLKDAAVGAANVVTGAVLKMVQLQGNAGGAAAAAVSATHNRSNRRMKSVVQDAAVGAVTNVVTGEVLRNGKLWIMLSVVQRLA